MTPQPAMTQMTWGAFVPHGGAADFVGWSGADAWARMRDAARAYDALGYDHLWVSDHFMADGGDRSSPRFEAYTALAALSQVTSRARLGALVTCSFYRSAGLLAKQASAVSVMSNGRFILSIGAGWDEQECAAYGIPFPSPRERVEIFGETLESVLRLMTEGRVTYAGTHVRLEDAVSDPRPPTKPEVWTGAQGPKGLRIAARHADVANFNVGLDDFVRLCGVLDEACAEVGRDPATMGRSVFRLAELTGDPAVVDAALARLGAPPQVADLLRDEHFVGTPDAILPKVQRFADAGARHIVLLFLDSATTDVSAERFLREVAPHVTT